MKLLYLGVVHAAWVPDTPFGFESQEGFCKAREEELIFTTIFSNNISFYIVQYNKGLVDFKDSQYWPL